MKTLKRRSTRGFTLVELLITMVMISILAAIAVPNFVKAVYKADAVRVVADMRTVGQAAMQQLGSTGTLPSPGTWGTIPPELVPYLPENFDFQYKDVEYAWSILGVGAPGAASADGWVEFVHAYNAVAPAAVQGGKGGKGGKGGGGKGGKGGGGGAGGGAAATGSVGVFWVRYAADSPIGEALQSHAGSSAFWTPTQMMFVVAG